MFSPWDTRVKTIFSPWEYQGHYNIFPVGLPGSIITLVHYNLSPVRIKGHNDFQIWFPNFKPFWRTIKILCTINFSNIQWLDMSPAASVTINHNLLCWGNQRLDFPCQECIWQKMSMVAIATSISSVERWKGFSADSSKVDDLSPARRVCRTGIS